MLLTIITECAALLTHHHLMLSTAESCTGGLLAAELTATAGASQWFDRGLITYTNQAKQELLGVPASVFEQEGAVSHACARAMVAGLFTHQQASTAIAITGIAGPTGGSLEKPVGTVYFGFGMLHHEIQTQQQFFIGNRHHIRAQACAWGLSEFLRLLKSAL